MLSDRHTAIYLRVSSKSQDLRSQEAELKRWAAAQDGPIRWYRDKATGTTMDRPGWRQLWADALAGQVDRIVVWRLDRLGRTVSGLTALFDELVARKIGLVSIREGFDLATVTGRMVAGILATIAQFETEVRSQRQTAGIEAAQAAGVRFGRPKGIHRPLKITADHQAVIRQMRGEGRGVTAIARTLGLSRQTIYTALAALPVP